MKTIREPKILFVQDMQTSCPVCGPWCEEVNPTPHIGYFIFVNSFGEQVFHMCTGCFVKAADALEEWENENTLANLPVSA